MNITKRFRAAWQALRGKASVYDSAGTGRRLRRWTTPQGSMNALLLGDLGPYRTVLATLLEIIRMRPTFWMS